jgi:Flp pilus assembly protein TadG
MEEGKMRKLARNNGAGDERGVTLVIFALFIVFLLGVAALAIDLGLLYVARSEAQRSADAAALAGANVFATSGCTSANGGCVAGGPQEAEAAAQAIATAAQNKVIGAPATVAWTQGSTCPTTATNNICFSYPSAYEPQITVTVHRAGIQTIFAKLFGVPSAAVDATATAEAYESSNNDCTVPFLLADCDTNTTAGVNPACPTSPASGYFIDPNTGDTDSASVGQAIVIHSISASGGTGGTGTGTSTTVPSQWYLAGLGANATPSGSTLRQYIQSCAAPVACGPNAISIPGNKIGPVDQGVNALIGASADGPNMGQDVFNSYPPLTYTSGKGITYTSSSSSSVVTVPVYNGTVNPDGSVNNNNTLSPGNTNTVNVVGYMQLFISYAQGPSGGKQTALPAPCQNFTAGSNDSPVCAVILNIKNCPGGTPQNTKWSPVPIRLIQGPTSP